MSKAGPDTDDKKNSLRAGISGSVPSHLPQVNPVNLQSESETLIAHDIVRIVNKRHILRGVSVGLKRGEAVGIMGPNGAGKTTLFYVIAGVTVCDRGKVILQGRDVTRLPLFRRARMGLGYLPQESSIFRGLSVENNIRAVLELLPMGRGERETHLESLLKEFDIAHLRRSNATELSGGERRRLEIARLLAGDPQFVLLDEPLAGVDPIAVADIRRLVAILQQRDIGVLITDHNVRETLETIDRAYVLHDGQIICEGTPAEITADERVRSVYLGERF